MQRRGIVSSEHIPDMPMEEILYIGVPMKFWHHFDWHPGNAYFDHYVKERAGEGASLDEIQAMKEQCIKEFNDFWDKHGPKEAEQDGRSAEQDSSSDGESK